MISKEPRISSEARHKAPRGRRDLASPAIAVGGIISAIAAQRVGETPIRIFSTATGLLAAGLGGSAWFVGRKAAQAESQADAAEKAMAQIITLPDSPVSDDDLTVVLDLSQPAAAKKPAVIDLSASADETVSAN